MARYKTAAQEKAEAREAVLRAPFKHTHFYQPMGMDRFDPRPHRGSSAIEPGSPVQNLGRYPGMGKGGGKLAFHEVRDQHGNHQSVFRGSLQSKRAAMSSPDDAMRWSPEAGEQEMGKWQSIFRDRRGER